MLRSLTAGAFACLLSAALVAQAPGGSGARVNLPFDWADNHRPIAVPSPNGKLLLRVTGKKTRRPYPDDDMEPDYFIERNGRRLSPAIHMYNSPYAMWSPSSGLLAITSTDGGLVGSWETFVYAVVGNKVVKHNVMQQVQADLARRYPGGVNPPGLKFFSKAEREKFARDVSWVNVLACRWLENPERLVVNAQVPPSSSCGANMGKDIAYVIEPSSGRILYSYPQQQSERLWEECNRN